ncbi:uncharacterized protein LOC136039570 [Artemia franciscana]|uniref:Uncharacterized protein n=1 Tax=Artemia franciscana TaxID=6661 RepID=A0AA88HZG1_ARTSF|nr:hypothetical protein QYM36_007282 [Artemia franciscana]
MKGKFFIVLFAFSTCVLAHVAELRSSSRMEKEDDPNLLSDELAPSSGEFSTKCGGICSNCCHGVFCCPTSCSCGLASCNCYASSKKLIRMVSNKNDVSNKKSQIEELSKRK